MNNITPLDTKPVSKENLMEAVTRDSLILVDTIRNLVDSHVLKTSPVQKIINTTTPGFQKITDEIKKKLPDLIPHINNTISSATKIEPFTTVSGAKVAAQKAVNIVKGYISSDMKGAQASVPAHAMKVVNLLLDSAPAGSKLYSIVQKQLTQIAGQLPASDRSKAALEILKFLNLQRSNCQ